tara:strand:- start:832 stop:1182 length:351 start_codon:yes stop_codon:yes gene_type:complete
MPKIEISIIIGYSNLSIFDSSIKTFDEFKTNKLETSIKILKKLEKLSLIKLSKNIFSVLVELLKIIIMVIKIIIDDRLKIRLKLFFVNTPIIKETKIDNIKKISGNNIFKLLIIFC